MIIQWVYENAVVSVWPMFLSEFIVATNNNIICVLSKDLMKKWMDGWMESSMDG